MKTQVMTKRDTKTHQDRTNYWAILTGKWAGPMADAFKTKYEAENPKDAEALRTAWTGGIEI